MLFCVPVHQAVMCSIARKDYTQFGEKGQQLFKEKVRGRELLVKVVSVCLSVGPSICHFIGHASFHRDELY